MSFEDHIAASSADISQWRQQAGPDTPKWLHDLVDALEAWVEEINVYRQQVIK